MQNVIKKMEEVVGMLTIELEQSIIKGKETLEDYKKANPVECISVEKDIQKKISITYNIEKTIKKLKKQITRLERISTYLD